MSYPHKTVGVKSLGGTIVSTHERVDYKANGKVVIAQKPVPSQKGLNIIMEALYKLQSEDIYAEVIGSVRLVDSSRDLTTKIRNESAYEIVNNLRTGRYDGIIVLHGSDQNQETVMWHHLMIKDPTLPIIITCAYYPPDHKDKEKRKEPIEKAQNSARIAVHPLSGSGIRLYDRGFVMSPYSRPQHFHYHDLAYVLMFGPTAVRNPLGRIKNGNYEPLSLGEKALKKLYWDLDAPFRFDPGERGFVKEPDIQGPIDISQLTPDGKSIPDFMIHYVLHRNKMKNTRDEEKREKLRSQFFDLTETYGVDGERLYKTFKDEDGQVYCDGPIDPRGIKFIDYSDQEPYEFVKSLDVTRGVIFKCSGCGNLRFEGTASHKKLLRELKDREIPVVITPMSYEVFSHWYMPELIYKYECFGGSFYRPDEVVPRLAIVVSEKNTRILKQVAPDGVAIKYLQRVLFDSGALFPVEERLDGPGFRNEYEQWTGVPTKAELLHLSFFEAATLAAEYARIYFGIEEKHKRTLPQERIRQIRETILNSKIFRKIGLDRLP